MVKQAVPAGVHDRQVGRIVLDGPEARPAARSDQKVRRARVLGRLVAEVTRVKLNALVRQRRRERQLEGPRVREQRLRPNDTIGDPHIG